MTHPTAPTEPAPTAIHAFEDLRAEVSLLRRAVEGLTAERQAAPDYRPTLEVIAKQGHDLIDWAGKVSQRPGIKLGPKSMADEIVKAGAAARQQDEAVLQRARHSFDDAVRGIEASMKSARSAKAQDRWIFKSNGITLVAGILIASIIPGPVARELPSSWAVPDRIAARVMGRPRWQAGAQMMAAADPDTWATFMTKIQSNPPIVAPAKQAR